MTIFKKSVALTVAPSREGHWRLAEYTSHAGFGRTVDYRNVHILSQQRGAFLPFCVIDGDAPVDLMKETIADLRASAEIDVAFMPIILMMRATSEVVVSNCITWGFDDVLAIPCTTVEFSRRIGNQMQRDLDYFRTDTYFGPDRRRSPAAANHPDRRGGEGFAFEKMTIRRHPLHGVKILSHEKFAADDIMARFA